MDCCFETSKVVTWWDEAVERRRKKKIDKNELNHSTQATVNENELRSSYEGLSITTDNPSKTCP